MSIRSLQTLVGKAVISDEFREAILNGRRAELIHDLDLEPEEVAGVMAIQANTLAEFAAVVEQMVRSREAPPLFDWGGEGIIRDREGAPGLSAVGFPIPA